MEEQTIYINPNADDPIYYYTPNMTLKIIIANGPEENIQNDQENQDNNSQTQQNENLENS